MHSYDTKSATFHFNGGLEGGDLIIIPKNGGEEIRIDANDVIELVAYKFVMDEKISKLEQATPRQLLLGEDR